MPFPLTGSEINVQTAVVNPSVAATPRATTVDWADGIAGNLFPGQVRSAQVSVRAPALATVLGLAPTRQWGGIGLTVLGSNQGWTVVT